MSLFQLPHKETYFTVFTKNIQICAFAIEKHILTNAVYADTLTVTPGPRYSGKYSVYTR